MTTTSAFAKYRQVAWPYRFAGTMHVNRICGGIPTDPKVAEGWLRTKLGTTDDVLIQQQVAEVMLERGVTPGEDDESVIAEVNRSRHLNGFKRERCEACPPLGQGTCPEGPHELYIEGRQLKAAIKESAMIAAQAGKLPGGNVWGKLTSKKGLKSFVAEHIGVVEDKLHLGVTEPTGVNQRFVHTRNGTGIQYEEYVDDAQISFTVLSDYDFTNEQWAMIWLTGEQQGIGATRSQGYGRYTVTSWERATEDQYRSAPS